MSTQKFKCVICKKDLCADSVSYCELCDRDYCDECCEGSNQYWVEIIRGILNIEKLIMYQMNPGN
jgi:hypothetical protein